MVSKLKTVPNYLKSIASSAKNSSNQLARLPRSFKRIAGAAAALACYVKENGIESGAEIDALVGLTGLEKDHKITLLTMELYEVLKNGGDAKNVLKTADEMLHRELGMIV